MQIGIIPMNQHNLVRLFHSLSNGNRAGFFYFISISLLFLQKALCLLCIALEVIMPVPILLPDFFYILLLSAVEKRTHTTKKRR